MSDTVQHIGLLGAGGLLGSEVGRQARARGWTLSAASSADVDARDERAVRDWLGRTKPDTLIVCAARNAGVHVNIASPADMLAENARIALASIGAARHLKIPRLLYCSSGAIYPANAPMPFREPDAGAGPTEESHFGYASAKLLGTRYCQSVRRQDGLNYTALLLTNIYGPGQNYDPSRSNVVASLIARLHDAKMRQLPEVVVWGTGEATRDLIFVEDAADVILMLATQSGPEDGLINIATGVEVSIQELATEIATVVGYSGALAFDRSKPEGARRRVADVSRLAALGWRPSGPLHDNLHSTYTAYLAQAS